jgi:hypothetical protein
MSVDRHERASAAPSVEPSVAETASEGDWMMAAIGEDEGDGEDDPGDLQLPSNDPHGGGGGDYAAEAKYARIRPHACEHRRLSAVCAAVSLT